MLTCWDQVEEIFWFTTYFNFKKGAELSEPSSEFQRLKSQFFIQFSLRSSFYCTSYSKGSIDLHVISSCSKRQFCVFFFNCIISKSTSTNLCVWLKYYIKKLKILYFFLTSMFEISYFCIKWYNFWEQKITWQPIFIFQSAVWKDKLCLTVDCWTW